MRIAVWYNLPSGGGKRALYDQVRGLTERGHHVEVWCPPTANRQYLDLGEMVSEHVVELRWRREASGPLSRWGNPIRLRLKFPALASHSIRCARQIEDRGFDILLAHSCMFMGAPFIGRYLRLAKVLYLQEPYRSLYEATTTNPWAAIDRFGSAKEMLRYPWARLKDVLQNGYRRLHVREECRNAKAFDRLLVNSYFSRESVLRSYGTNATVCYLGIDRARFEKKRVTERQDIIITIGGLTRSKRLGFIVEAVSNLAKPRPKLVCVSNVIDPHYRAEVIRQASDKGVDLEIREEISHEELCHLMSISRLLAYAPRLEPFGYAPLEANACGLPVVAVAEGGIRETVRDGINGLLVDDDPKAMAQAMERLLRNPTYAEELGRAGAEEVIQRWNLSSAIDRLEGYLQDAIQKR